MKKPTFSQLAIPVVVVAWVFFTWYVKGIYDNAPTQMEHLGQLGDSYAILNSILTIMALGALVYQNNLQKRELDSARNQAHKDSFENGFFNMLDSMRHQADQVKINIGTDSGFQQFNNTSHDGPNAFDIIEQLIRHRLARRIGTGDQTAISEEWKMGTMQINQYLLSLDVLLKHVFRFDPEKADVRRQYYEIIASSLTAQQVSILQMGLNHKQFEKNKSMRVSELLASLTPV